jgi:tetratricopeptide (TPR) repeat protein
MRNVSLFQSFHSCFDPFLAHIGRICLKFGPAEYLMVAVFALSIIAAVIKGAVIKGLISGFIGILLSFGVMISSCAKAPRKPEAALDTPEHHVFSGNKLLEKGDTAGAQREFELAIQLNKKFSPAYVGMGLVLGVQKNYEVMIKAAVASLKRLEKLPPDPKDLPKAIKDYLIDTGKVDSYYSEIETTSRFSYACAVLIWLQSLW